MAQTLKCPNPSCSYLFDPATVPAGVVVACPRCTMQFTIGPPATAPTHPSTPPAQRPQDAPTAFDEMTPETARADHEEGPRLPVRTSRLQMFLLLGVAAVALAAAGLALLNKLTDRPQERTRGGAMQFTDQNFSFEPPPSPWIQDGEMQATLGSPYIRVYRRDNPEAYIAIGARDYSRQQPRRSELRQSLIAPLRKILVANTLEEQQIPPDTSWLGQPVKGFNFRGQLRNGSNVQGEAYYVAYKGIGYWFLAWTGENEIYAEQSRVFTDVRSRCQLLGERESWSPRQTNVVQYKNNVLGYSILDGEGIWNEVTDVEQIKGQDPSADKYLTARVKQMGSDTTYEAELVTLVLDNAGDPLQQAREYLEKRENQDVENLGKTTFQAHIEDTGFDEPNPVEGDAPYVLLKGTNSRSGMSRLWAISAIKVGEKTVAAIARCEFNRDDRELFERKFVALVRSLRASE